MLACLEMGERGRLQNLREWQSTDLGVDPAVNQSRFADRVNRVLHLEIQPDPPGQ